MSCEQCLEFCVKYITRELARSREWSNAEKEREVFEVKVLVGLRMDKGQDAVYPNT